MPKRNVNSPLPPKNLKKSIKISDQQRRQLKRLKKDNLITLAGQTNEPLTDHDTRADIAHRLSRNQMIAAALTTISVPALILTKKWHTRK